jgi:hypothetical protein
LWRDNDVIILRSLKDVLEDLADSESLVKVKGLLGE